MTATAANANGKPRQRRPWAPDGDDHLIFDLVRMKGKTQERVAVQLGISQATVSRVVERYERWRAHVRECEAGLSHAERLRFQRWLTYERNELMLASCLRIAANMESFHCSSSTTKVEKGSQTTQSTRTQYDEIDCSGIAARFLRLGFRINMEQQKLTEKDQLPDLPPLSAEEIAEQEELAAAASAEILAANNKSIEDFNRAVREDIEQQREIDRLKKIEEAERLELAERLLRERESTQDEGLASTKDEGQRTNEADLPPTVGQSTALSYDVVNKVNNLHNENGAENGASADGTSSCDAEPALAKIAGPSCITGQGEAQWPANGRSQQPSHRRRESRNGAKGREQEATRAAPRLPR
jgi:hypothetical protein